MTFAGCYRLEVSAELIAFVERTFVEPAAPERREVVRAETLAELAGSELVLSADGSVASRANGQEWFRVRVDPSALANGSVTFEKAPGVEVALERLGLDTLRANQPGKPPLVYRRV